MGRSASTPGLSGDIVEAAGVVKTEVAATGVWVGGSDTVSEQLKEQVAREK